MAESGRRGSPMLGLGLGLNQRSDTVGAIVRFWQSSYAPEYLGLTILLVAYILIQSFVKPFHRMFALDDHNIQFPHAINERVPLNLLIIYGLVVPAAAITMWAGIFRPPLHKVHITFLGLLTSTFLTVFITDVIKNAVGRPRPDLLDRCKPAAGTPTNMLVTYTICTQTNLPLLHDGFRSFPSGHSSWSFSGLGFLSFLLAGQLHVFSPPAPTPLPFLLLSFTPLLGALLIAISRCEDYRHDVYDVCTGSIIGLAVAYFVYRRYYPALTSPRCETPWPSRKEVLIREGKLRRTGAGDVESGRLGASGSAPLVGPGPLSRSGSSAVLNGGGPGAGRSGVGVERDDESDEEEEARFLRHPRA